jgi:hypothetical protein
MTWRKPVRPCQLELQMRESEVPAWQMANLKATFKTSRSPNYGRCRQDTLNVPFPHSTS